MFHKGPTPAAKINSLIANDPTRAMARIAQARCIAPHVSNGAVNLACLVRNDELGPYLRQFPNKDPNQWRVEPLYIVFSR
jgi:hypothetical protein